MHAIQIYIDETLDAAALSDLRQSLLDIPHVENVVFNDKDPHDVLVEYEEQHVMPMDIIENMSNRGLHSDIISG